jgi:hypothetical protein
MKYTKRRLNDSTARSYGGQALGGRDHANLARELRPRRPRPRPGLKHLAVGQLDGATAPHQRWLERRPRERVAAAGSVVLWSEVAEEAAEAEHRHTTLTRAVASGGGHAPQLQDVMESRPRSHHHI